MVPVLISVRQGRDTRLVTWSVYCLAAIKTRLLLADAF
jgi:hypothetical protein